MITSCTARTIASSGDGAYSVLIASREAPADGEHQDRLGPQVRPELEQHVRAHRGVHGELDAG
jgi:hypothetical protein